MANFRPENEFGERTCGRRADRWPTQSLEAASARRQPRSSPHTRRTAGSLSNSIAAPQPRLCIDDPRKRPSASALAGRRTNAPLSCATPKLDCVASRLYCGRSEIDALVRNGCWHQRADLIDNLSCGALQFLDQNLPGGSDAQRRAPPSCVARHMVACRRKRGENARKTTLPLKPRKYLGFSLGEPRLPWGQFAIGRASNCKNAREAAIFRTHQRVCRRSLHTVSGRPRQE